MHILSFSRNTNNMTCKRALFFTPGKVDNVCQDEKKYFFVMPTTSRCDKNLSKNCVIFWTSSDGFCILWIDLKRSEWAEICIEYFIGVTYLVRCRYILYMLQTHEALRVIDNLQKLCTCTVANLMTAF